ncbi:MAG: Ppx/GppA family phosphatase [Firmicutes bacterium]|nr:Ppx/GppA family phosphatase [Bacillota bacterium]
MVIITENPILAIIDIGSNSLRLMVAKRLKEGGAVIIDERKETPRLALAKDTEGFLTLDGFSRLIQALQYFRDVAQAFNADPIIVRATAALRNLANQQQVLQEINRQTGLTVEVLSGDEEAAIGFLAVKNSIPLTKGWTIDVGGGSTEIVSYENGDIRHQRSFAFGAVSLSSLNLSLTDMMSWVQEQYAQVNWLQTRSPQSIALGGSARVMARSIQHESEYPLQQIHAFRVPTVVIDAWLAKIALMTPDQRKKVAHIPKDRLDIIVPGIAIILGLLKTTQSDTLTISGYGLRNGLLLQHMESNTPTFPSLALDSAWNVALRSEWPSGLTKALQEQVSQLGKAVKGLLGLSERSMELVQSAALLRYCGRNVNMYHWDRHTFYHILGSSLTGLNHQEWVSVALIASYRSSKRLQKFWSPFSSIVSREQLVLVRKLGVLLRLAEIFSAPSMNGVERLSVQHSNKQLIITVSGTGISCPIEELKDVAKDIKKSWQMKLVVPGLLN